MVEFSRPETAQFLIGRLQRMAMTALGEFIEQAFEHSANPDVGLANLERWLSATSNPSLHLAHLASSPKLAQLLVMVLSASQSISDCLVQNPELAGILYDRDELSRYPSFDSILSEGRQLLSASTSYSHSLDRLRYLKQRWTLPIVVSDLAGFWNARRTWTALSALADALISLCLDVAWSEYRFRKGIDQLSPIMVVAFGKLGGNELNLSSDVDLVYICPDNLDDKCEKHLTRACELYNRALSDRMGRGSLYRIDLRLRPFGGAGSLVQSMRSVEAYYRSYAETWEAQALIRSRPVVGPPELIERWRRLREAYCFRPRIPDLLVEEIVGTRNRIEEHAEPNDIKRGPGGIRDIEFIAQILQMVHGASHTSVRCESTVQALEALSDAGLLDSSQASDLIAAYELLRTVEHRCQLVGDLQTHHLPEKPMARSSLAQSSGYPSWEAFADAIGETMAKVRRTYQQAARLASSGFDARAQALHAAGPWAPVLSSWFDSLPQSDAYYQSLVENEGSLRRVGSIAVHASAMVPRFKESVEHTDNLVSGEIEEELDIVGRYARLSPDADLQAVAETFKAVWLTVAVQTVLNGYADPGERLRQNMDGALAWLWTRHGRAFDIVGLGSLAQHDLSFHSDADVLFLMDDRRDHARSEASAQALIGDAERMARLGAPIAIDLRLRPEGGKGLLVRSYDGFLAYEAEDMELWERFALGQSRLVCGNPEAMAHVHHAAYRRPLDKSALDELLAMKARIENERVNPIHRRRDVKLGHGGLSDIDWMVHLWEMRLGRYPDDMQIEARIGSLADEGIFSADEQRKIVTSRRFLIQVRSALQLMGVRGGIVPENPDKLAVLAHGFSMDGPNDFLREYENTIEAVRSIYLDAINRLSS